MKLRMHAVVCRRIPLTAPSVDVGRLASLGDNVAEFFLNHRRMTVRFRLEDSGYDTQPHRFRHPLEVLQQQKLDARPDGARKYKAQD